MAVSRLAVLSRVLMPTTLEALKWAGLQRGSRCLDLGCGDGLATHSLAQAVGRVGRVVGLDADPAAVKAATGARGREGGGGGRGRGKARSRDERTRVSHGSVYTCVCV